MGFAEALIVGCALLIDKVKTIEVFWLASK